MEEIDRAAGRNRLILVVDDHVDSLEMTALVLRECGWRVTEANSADAAVAAISVETPVLILSDLSMPKVDGVGLMAHFQASPGTAGVPFVFVTGHADDLTRSRLLQAGAAGVFSKPVQWPVLLETITLLANGQPLIEGLS